MLSFSHLFDHEGILISLSNQYRIYVLQNIFIEKYSVQNFFLYKLYVVHVRFKIAKIQQEKWGDVYFELMCNLKCGFDSCC